MRKWHKLFWTGLLGAMLVSCATTSAPDTTAAAATHEWVLDPEKDSTMSIILRRGMSDAQVVEVLKAPRRKRVVSKTEPVTEGWTYQRRVHGANSLTSTRTRGGGSFSAFQRMIYIETVKLVFVANKLDRVTMTRIRDTTTPGSPLVGY